MWNCRSAAGSSGPGAHERVDLGQRSFACFYLAEGKLIAADCVNSAQEFMFSKRAIAEGLSPDPSLLADSQTPLASLLRAPAMLSPADDEKSPQGRAGPASTTTIKFTPSTA